MVICKLEIKRKGVRYNCGVVLEENKPERCVSSN